MSTSAAPRILVLEDRPNDRLYLTTLLGYRGFTVLEASNGEDGLAIAAERRPDLVISDVLMPRMDGYEFVRRLRRMEGCATVPVIFYTATYHEGDARRLAEECGVVEVLLKPSEPEVILSRIEAALTPGQAPVITLTDEAFGRRHVQVTTETLLDKIRALEGSERANSMLIGQLEHQAAELREREEVTEFALAAAGIGVYERRFANGEVRVSRGLRELLNVPAGNSLDDFSSVFPEDDRRRILDIIQRAIDARGDFTFDVALDRGGPKPRYIQVRGQIEPDEQRQPKRLLSVLIDLTERRELEEQLRQAQKMEAIGQLAGGVAHDFNNLLTVIQGYSRFLLESAHDDEQRRDAAAISQAGEQAVGLTRQLLAFSRKQARDVVVIDLNLLIEDVARMLRRLVGEHYQLTTVLDPRTGAINNDRGQIEQVVMNLVVNARDAMPQGGTITIAADRVQDRGRDWVRLRVGDQGTGMSAETRSRIFEPFFTTKPAGKGTGLGLATVFSIVSQSGGTVSVESEPGRGTTFTILLPPAQTDAVAATVRKDALLTGSEKVLVVEDDPAIRVLIKAILGRAQYAVTVAANATEALAQPTEQFDVVVTDVLMPGGTGPELVASLRARRPGVRVVYISGYAPEETLDVDSFDDRTTFLAKPFTPETLTKKIREVLER